VNYRGSYRKLLGNARAAMIAAVDVYNKPVFRYRDECCAILLVNAWELLLKAILSRNKNSIYYPKKRGEDYRTFSWKDAFTKAESYFPPQVAVLPIRRNLELLAKYRDNAVHFYNVSDFGILIYSLAQTSIVNFRDLLIYGFGVSLRDEFDWNLLPLGLEPPIDAVTYIASTRDPTKKPPFAVRQYIAELTRAIGEVEEAGSDTGRLLTVFAVKMESTKKIELADIVVGVAGEGDSPTQVTVNRWQNPNVTHPHRRKNVVSIIASLHDVKFTPYVFDAIVWQYQLKSKPQYCWQADEGILTKYSNDVAAFIRRLTREEVDNAIRGYKAFQRTRQRRHRDDSAQT